MIRYVIALFLINTYSRSLGAPANQPPTSITDLLDSLAKNCENLFIKTQIEITTQNNCSSPALDHNGIYKCLIFYDINSQLCSAINNSKLISGKEYLAQIEKTFDVKDLCESAKDWTFSSNLNVNLTTVFQDPVKCEKFCGVDNIYSTDSIFFCKYFDWGWKKLNPAKKLISDTTQKVRPSGAMSQETIIATTGLGQNNVSTLNLTHSETPMLNHNDGQEQKDLDDIHINVTPRSSSGANPFANLLSTVTMVSSSNTTKGDVGNDNAKQSSDNNIGLNTSTSNPKSDFVPQLPKDPLLNIKNSKQEDDTGDDNFGNDMDADDEDNADNADGDSAENPVVPKEIPSGQFLHKDYYSPDLTPEDDHFFPFFLTAIVLVVLVYILYHNKGKVTKVFLGLIVEGRQNGRRRNSRGHAYRRLDTLEQAMSGNLAAQPSKIIY